MAGLITAALGGAGEGLEKGANLAGGLYIKGQIEEEHQRMLQEAQAQREERNIRLTKQLERENKAAEPRIIPAGATERTPGQPDYTAPIKTTPEELGVYNAHANYYNALAASIRRGDRAKSDKATLPKVIVKDDGQGNTFLFDENSGAIGTIMPGAPAQEAKSGFLGFGAEPGKPAQPHNVVWKSPTGSVMPNGLAAFYPDLQKRAPEEGAPAAPSPSGERPPLADFFKGKPTASAAAPAARPAAPTIPAPAPKPVEAGAGPVVDVAKQKLSAASARLQSYGLRQQRSDPQGYAAAQQAVAAAQREYDSVLAQYQNELGPVGAARFKPR